MSKTNVPVPAVADFAEIDPVRCPCGWARRALAEVADGPMTLHRVDICEDARTHYHKRQTETYYFLECGPDAQMELDGRLIPVKAGMCVFIPPGTRHRAVGAMKILNVVIPPFDPDDEWFD